jgi:hypothetical protein
LGSRANLYYLSDKHIIIFGYPKSGTHWITQLTTDLVDGTNCKNWGFNMNRPKSPSGFYCHKSHHLFEELQNASIESIYKVIQVVRDPRDIVISGSYFFRFTFPKLAKALLFLPFNKALYRHIEGLLNQFMSSKDKRWEMIKAVLFGNESVSPWCKNSWYTQNKSYQREGVLTIRYEDMQSEPEKQCETILEFLDLNYTKERIQKALLKNEFNNNKKRYKGSYPLFRKGSFGYWKNELTKNEKALFKSSIKKELAQYGYE